MDLLPLSLTMILCKWLPGRGLKPKTFDFLGFTHICGKRKDTGGFKLVRLTMKKRMRATLKAIRKTLVKRRHEPIPAIGSWLGKVVSGYLNYHSVPDNLHRMNGFVTEVKRATGVSPL